jgi:hypothetical protein
MRCVVRLREGRKYASGRQLRTGSEDTAYRNRSDVLAGSGSGDEGEGKVRSKLEEAVARSCAPVGWVANAEGTML